VSTILEIVDFEKKTKSNILLICEYLDIKNVCQINLGHFDSKRLLKKYFCTSIL